MSKSIPRITAAEAASQIKDGQTIAFSGFTPAGAPKAISKALGARAIELHKAGQPFSVGVITGASTGASLDGALAQADAIRFRTPYQNNSDLRKSINSGRTRFFDMHLSALPQAVRSGLLGPVHWAVIEACSISDSGEIVLTSGVGASPTFCRKAEKIFIELNKFHSPALRGFHDIYEPEDLPNRKPIMIMKPSDRIGQITIKVDPSKIAGIIETNLPDEIKAFDSVSETAARIGDNVAQFLAAELKRGVVPKEFLPVQSGVGDTANAVLAAMGACKEIPPFQIYTEVIQDAVINLMRKGKVTFASGCSLTVSTPVIQGIYAEIENFRPKIVLRPQEISNNPEVIRRLGLISINTAIETDISGNANSTHILGAQIVSGIGGSGDFARNAFLSIFTSPSTTKGGKISTIVPMVCHLDSSEHSVQVIVTEQGVADLRGKSPMERAETIISNCAHPEYRSILRDYVKLAGHTHSPQTLRAAFGMHTAFINGGDMRKVDWAALK
jgi:acetyl-CoA hydrolase